MKYRMLVVVDYQNDFVDGALGFPGAEKLDEGIASKVRAYGVAGDFIVVTRDTHSPAYLSTREGRALPVEHCIDGSRGWELYGKTGEALLALSNSDEGGGRLIAINKTTFGVHPMDMMDHLPREAPESIEFVGLVSNMCVLSNVCCFQARYPESQIYVDPGLCASFDRELHHKTMDILRGIQVIVKE